jgi:hypothetical protein
MRHGVDCIVAFVKRAPHLVYAVDHDQITINAAAFAPSALRPASPQLENGFVERRREAAKPAEICIFVEISCSANSARSAFNVVIITDAARTRHF